MLIDCDFLYIDMTSIDNTRIWKYHESQLRDKNRISALNQVKIQDLNLVGIFVDCQGVHTSTIDISAIVDIGKRKEFTILRNIDNSDKWRTPVSLDLHPIFAIHVVYMVITFGRHQQLESKFHSLANYFIDLESQLVLKHEIGLHNHEEVVLRTSGDRSHNAIHCMVLRSDSKPIEFGHICFVNQVVPLDVAINVADVVEKGLG